MYTATNDVENDDAAAMRTQGFPPVWKKRCNSGVSISMPDLNDRKYAMNIIKNSFFLWSQI